MWTFEEPAYLLLLFVLPVLVWLKHFWKGRGGRLKFPLGLWKGLKFQPSIPGMRIVMFTSNIALWLSLLCLIVALAGPALTHQEKVFLNPGSDIMIVLDESPSMAAKDFPPQN